MKALVFHGPRNINVEEMPDPKAGKWEWLKDERIELLDNPFDQIYQYYRVIKDRVDKAIRRFPFGTLDVLDMLCLGIRGTVRPLSGEEIRRQKEEDKRFKERHANAAGY